jgi:hypothetical protein
MAVQTFVLEQLLDESLYEEMLLNCDDEDINIIVATRMFMRRDLHRNESFCEVVVPSYSIDEFKCHFRMCRATLEILCRETAATGMIPQARNFGRPPIPLENQVLSVYVVRVQLGNF